MTSGGHFRKGIWGNINFAYSTNGHDFWESVCFTLMCKGWQASSHIMVQPHLLPGHNKLLLQKLTWDKHGKCGLFCWWLCLLQMIYLRIHQRWGEWQWHLFAWPLSLGGSLLTLVPNFLLEGWSFGLGRWVLFHLVWEEWWIVFPSPTYMTMVRDRG